MHRSVRPDLYIRNRSIVIGAPLLQYTVHCNNLPVIAVRLSILCAANDRTLRHFANDPVVCRDAPEVRSCAIRCLTRDCVPEPKTWTSCNQLGPAACRIRTDPRQLVSESCDGQEKRAFEEAAEERGRRTTCGHANRPKVAERKICQPAEDLCPDPIGRYWKKHPSVVW